MPGRQIIALTEWTTGQNRRPCPEWDRYVLFLVKEAEDTAATEISSAATGILAESAQLKWDGPRNLIMEIGIWERTVLPTFPLMSRRPLLVAREKAMCSNGTNSRHTCKGEGYDFILSFYCKIRVMCPTGMVITERTNQVQGQEAPDRKNRIWGTSSWLLHRPSTLYYKGSET